MPITYFQNDVVTITYDVKMQLGTAVWNGFLSSTEFREASETCLRLVEEHKPLRWLGDNCRLRVSDRPIRIGLQSISPHASLPVPFAIIPSLSLKTSLTEWGWIR